MRSLGFAILIVVTVIGLGGWWVYQQGIGLHQDETPVVQFTEEPELTPLTVTIIEQLAATVRAISCTRGVCQTEDPAPADTAVTDGTWWYYYDNESGDTSEGVILQRKHGETAEHEEIMRETPLTAPRGLLIGPHGKRLAFFLDNIADPEDQLTELWVYDAVAGGVRLVAEKLFVPDIRSTIRWNAAGTHLWFIADNGEQGAIEDELELVVIDVDNPGAAVVLPGTSWDERLETIIAGPSDIKMGDPAVAFVSASLLRQPVLEIVTADSSNRTTARGDIPYLQWLQDGSLLYAVQDRTGFTFWRRTDDNHNFVARRSGFLQSARTTAGDEYVSFAVRAAEGTPPRVLSLHIDSGRVG